MNENNYFEYEEEEFKHHKQFRSTLQRARIEKRLSQRKLSELTGISEKTINKLDNGNYESLTIKNAKLIAKALDTTVTALFFSEEYIKQGFEFFEKDSRINEKINQYNKGIEEVTSSIENILKDTMEKFELELQKLKSYEIKREEGHL